MGTPRAPFDQGLFLAHFNKGKDLFDAKRYEEAERQLEEAYLLRPRDQKVLNLLGLVYFKQDKYEKAEEIYRKLTAESPEANTLYYNLGLIYFKLQRLEEAESAFTKALELQGDNPKINFYLGSIYERMKRYQDAIYQYRQAGANILVRRVEDKLAAQPRTVAPARPPASEPKAPPAPAQVTLPPPPPEPESTTIPRGRSPFAPPPTPRTEPFPPVLAAATAPPKTGADTNRFKAAEVREAIERAKREHEAEEAAAFPPRSVAPVSPSLMAEGAKTSETARFHVSELAPGVRHPEIISYPARGGAERTQPLATDRTLPPPPRRPEVFRFLENNLMEIDFSGKVFIKQGTIYSYGGNLTFWVKEKRPGGHPPLVMITGQGRVILTDREREITFMHVQEEAIHVEPAHLLACESTLTPRYVSVGSGPEPAEFLVLEGTGMLALSVASKPLPLVVTPDMPVSVPASSIISWSGSVTAQAVEDRQVYEVMLPGRASDRLVRLEGSGRLLVEQGLR